LKTSLGNKIINRILKIIGAKNLYQGKDFLHRQKKINEKIVNPPLTNVKMWNKYELNDFYYFYSKAKSQEQILIYFHGGAFVSGPNIFHWNYLKKLKKSTKLPIYFPIYPKAPNFNYEVAYKFIFEFYSHILKKHPNSQFVFMGDSAGGNIALSFALQLRDKDIKLPSKIILFSPCLDLTFSDEKINEMEKQNIDPLLATIGLKLMAAQWVRPSADFKNPIFSPINANFDDINNILLFVGTHEILYPEACKFNEKFKKENKHIVFVEKSYLLHAWPLHPIAEAKQALKIVKDFILK
jgi:acetyl esterase/lipase